MLNDLGLPRDPALRSMEVVKRLKNQGVPWQQRGAQDGQEMSGWTKNPAIPSCQQRKNVGGLTYFTMMCLHFYQIRPPFVRDFESHHCWLRWPTLPKLSCLDEPQVDRTYKASMHDFWHGSSFRAGLALPFLIVSYLPIAPIAWLFPNQPLMVTRFCG